MEKGTKNRSLGGGSKLNRSETVTIRLDPKLRYLTELAARKQRRTVSSFIEWAIERAIDSVVLREHDNYGRGTEESLGDRAEELWDTDEPDRLAKLGLLYPELLTHDEQVLWKLIKEHGPLWLGKQDKDGYWKWEIKEDSLVLPRLRELWDTLKQVATGEADKSALPKWTERKSTLPTAKPTAKKEEIDIPPLDDDDIPF